MKLKGKEVKRQSDPNLENERYIRKNVNFVLS
jgi:hypothetical protein